MKFNYYFDCKKEDLIKELIETKFLIKSPYTSHSRNSQNDLQEEGSWHCNSNEFIFYSRHKEVLGKGEKMANAQLVELSQNRTLMIVKTKPPIFLILGITFVLMGQTWFISQLKEMKIEILLITSLLILIVFTFWYFMARKGALGIANEGIKHINHLLLNKDA